MSKTTNSQPRKIWQPLNHKSQILATIAVVAFAAVQVHGWYARSTQAQPPSIQQSVK